MSSFTAPLKYEPTGRRTDDGSKWRSFFGDNWVGLMWGQPIVRLAEEVTYRFPLPDTLQYADIHVPAGFECDLGTAPGPIGYFIRFLETVGAIPKTLNIAAVVHDRLWAWADNQPLEDQEHAYWFSDVVFHKLLKELGNPGWWAAIVYTTVRTAGNLKVLLRKLNK